MSEIQPMWELHQLVAALRTSGSDVASYTRVLTAALGDALPPQLVDVEYRKDVRGLRGLRARSRPVRITVHAKDQRLVLSEDRGEVRAERHRVVHDVVISRKEIEIDEWLAALAAQLHALAARNEATRDALSRLLGL